MESIELATEACEMFEGEQATHDILEEVKSVGEAVGGRIVWAADVECRRVKDEDEGSCAVEVRPGVGDRSAARPGKMDEERQRLTPRRA